ncbi:hypothetical protein A0H81_12106 [Grifola frondosa]|uniref:DUF6533 domain-containing protein n=1 Tax=Grifola frondosa TaxID=5627 RepID=A0A1C7LUR5_GRIFR|nr:hypothetical protein A0H81_12106 [Grifola frondosa]
MSDIASIAADEKTIISTLYYTATALFCYDYILTFGSEVQFMWRSKLSIAAIVFYVVRYAALFNTLFTILETLQGPTVTNLR